MPTTQNMTLQYGLYRLAIEPHHCHCVPRKSFCWLDLYPFCTSRTWRRGYISTTSVDSAMNSTCSNSWCLNFVWKDMLGPYQTGNDAHSSTASTDLLSCTKAKTRMAKKVLTTSSLLLYFSLWHWSRQFAKQIFERGTMDYFEVWSKTSS